MATATVALADIAALQLGEESKLDDREDETSASKPQSSVDSDDVTGTVKKKVKKKKKRRKGADQREKVVLPTQALVSQCFPWTAAYKPDVGRCAISSRPIKAGELVVAEQAVAFVPRSQDRLAVCHACCSDVSPPAPSFVCPGCHFSVFCKDCKDEAMKSHTIWCPVSCTIASGAKVADCDEDLLRLVLALALQRHATARITSGDPVANGSSNQGTVKDGIIYPSYEDAICLETHSDKATALWKASVKAGCQRLYEEAVKAQNEVNFTLDDLQTLAALVNTNSHGMGAHGSGIHNSDVAVGIFPFVSILNHSCRPNCCFASEGRVMCVRATQDIPKGTELCVSYINLYEPRGTRKMQLAVTKHFVCRCERCSEPFSSSVDRFLEGCVCTARGCGGVVVKSTSFHDQDSSVSRSSSSSSWLCDRCSRTFDPDFASNPLKNTGPVEYPWQLVAKAEQRLAEAMSVYRERRFKDARLLLANYVAEFTGKLHPLNVLLFDALTPLMNCCRAAGDAAEGSRICRKILDCMEKVLPGISLELANFYFCLGEMYLERSQASSTNVMIKHYRRLAQETLQHVRDIRETCLGKPSLPS